MTAAPPSHPSRQSRIPAAGWLLLLVLGGTAFLEGLDMSMMAVALPAMRNEFGMSSASLQWVMSGYVLGYGGFVLLGGRAADLLGRRRMFLLWLSVFVAFSGVGGIAVNGWMLIVARFVTGIAAAFLTPASMSIITTRFTQGPQRHRALLVFAGVGAGGFSLGMVVGGLLAAIDWRWVFFAPVLIAAALLALAVRTIPADEETRPSGTRRFDVPGTLTLTAGMLVLVFGLVESPDVPPLRTAVVLAVGVALIGAFVAVERRSAVPLIRLGILRSGALVRANLGALLFLAAFVGFQFVTVLYLQDLRQWSELQTGLAMMVMGLDAVLAPTLTPVLVRRFGNARVLVVGVATSAIAYALFLALGADWTYAAMLPSFLLVGLAFTLAYGPLAIAATDGVDESEQGLAGGLFTMSLQFGAALGLAVVAAVLAAASPGDVSSEELLAGYRSALLVPLVAAGLGLVVAAIGAASGGRRRSNALHRSEGDPTTAGLSPADGLDDAGVMAGPSSG